MGTPSGAEGRGTSGGRVTAEGVGREEVEAAKTLRATDAVAIPSGQPVVTVVGVVDDDEAERTERTERTEGVGWVGCFAPEGGKRCRPSYPTQPNPINFLR